MSRLEREAEVSNILNRIQDRRTSIISSLYMSNKVDISPTKII